MRRFNTAGPNDSAIHYTLPAMRRMPGVRAIIEGRGYFVLHAPRQVGKTTSLVTLAQDLTLEGTYTAVLVSMEVGAPFSDKVGVAEGAILESWRRAARAQLPPELCPPPWPDAAEGGRIGAALEAWSRSSTRPLVLFLDEIDALQDDALISILRQLRDGYRNRPEGFPWSLALIGLRDVRDYKVGNTTLGRMGTASPFNIKVESLTLRNFTRDEVAELYGQHTAETGQIFEPGVIDRVFELTQGQPWLVNALARQLVEVLVPDAAGPVTLVEVDRAKEILIQRRDTHLDSLAERLREPRVRQIIEPMLAGDLLPDIPEDDRRFVIDLGLVARAPGGLEIANPIYREVIPRVLAGSIQDSLGMVQPTWLRIDGTLDPDRLLQAFLEFWREHGEALLTASPYHEVAPHLVMMAFLHRVVNGGGTVHREYAIGRGRVDLLVTHGKTRMAIELKVWKPRQPDPLTRGLTQLDGYMAGLGLSRGWLVIFDRRPDLPPAFERTNSEVMKTPGGRDVVVVRG